MQRRRFIRGSTALAGVLFLTGCIDGNGEPEGDNGTEEESSWEPTEFEETNATYEEYLFSPTTSPELEEYSFRHTGSGLLGEVADGATQTLVESDDSRVSIEVHESQGEFEQSVTQATLAPVFEDGSEPDRTVSGYEIYLDEGLHIAVNTDELIYLSSTEGDVVEAAIGTVVGDTEPVTETDPNVGELVEAMGGGDFVMGDTNPPPQLDRGDAYGAVSTIEEENVNMRFCLVYSEGASPESEPLADFVSDAEWTNQMLPSSPRESEVRVSVTEQRVDGRTAVVEASSPRDALFAEENGRSEEGTDDEPDIR